MKPKQRLIVRYALVGLVCIGVCVAAAVSMLDRSEEIPDEGLVPGLTDSLAHGRPSSAPRLRFTRMPLDFRHFPGTRTHRLPEDMGSGVAVEDFDGDGLPDLFFVNAGPLGREAPACALFRNRGDFRFERVGVPLPALLGLGVAAGDFDGDGDLDLYVTGYSRNVLLRNEGALRFTDVTDAMGVSAGGFSTGACWGDADGDGDIDLYVCRYVEFDETMSVSRSKRGAHGLPVTLNPSAFPAQSNLLFLNPGKEGEKFREAAGEFGVSNPGGKSLAAVFADLDGDGLLDLYVANDVSDNAFFLGVSGQPFRDVTHASCTADWRGAMGLAIGDPDRDKDLDLFITHWLPEENTLYRKEDGLFFSDAAAQTLLGPPSRGLVGWACDFADLDCDGRPDLVVVNGSTFEQPTASVFLVPMPVQLFWNDGARFFDLAPEAGAALQAPVVGRGGTVADLDGDGDMDIVVVVHGGKPLLLRNDSESMGGYIKVVVRGSQPNVFGYGATVTVGGQTQQVGVKVSYLSSGPHPLHFGLGERNRVEVVVRYPSGKTVRRQARAGQTLVVKEVDPRSLGALMDRARDGGDVPVYREILRLDPLHPGALFNLALLVEPKEALELCRKLLRVEPMAPRGHLLSARILSDPQRPGPMDLDRALREIDLARKLNRDETGGQLERGRVLLLQGNAQAAAEMLEKARQNPRAAALAALARFRNGEPEAARKLLDLHRKKHAMNVQEEGDTAGRKMGARDVLAALLELPAAAMEQAQAPEDSTLKAVRAVRYDFEAAARWALDPPETCAGTPPAATAVVRADIDGDGDEDLVVALGCDPAAPLPWFILYRENDAYRPVRGALPKPGFVVRAIAVSGGRVLLSGGDAWLAAPH